MVLQEQKKRLLKAKIAVALQSELGRVPKTEEIDQVFLLSRVMYKAVLGLHLIVRNKRGMGNWQSFNDTTIHLYAHWLCSCFYLGSDPQPPPNLGKFIPTEG
jgi:hypothetical protein